MKEGEYSMLDVYLISPTIELKTQYLSFLSRMERKWRRNGTMGD